MRHKKKGKKLERDKDHRKALLANLVNSLLFHEEITTTKAKAKETVRFTEKIITLAKKNSLHSRRGVLKFLRDKRVVSKLFEVITPRYENRKGGYTQIVKLGYRKGDNALMCKVKLL
ncbi:50S ribosomal protein L17 [Candidatus Aerophobetes bacterium]|nr:50S ribosomal protein L17 [Candidatus Aerophobetes bacterium]